MADLFGRVVELYVNKKMFSGDDFTIYFEVHYDILTTDNIAKIKIYNLSDSTIHNFGSNPYIILNAGYRGDVGAIFLGLAKSITTTWSGVDKITEFEVSDGADAYYSQPIKKTYAKGATAQSIIADISSFTGIKLGEIKLPKNYVYKSGKAIKGKLTSIISGIAKDCGAKAYVRNGQLFIRPATDGKVIGFQLDASHGLVGTPTPVDKELDLGDKKKTKLKVRGFKVVSLLNHRITTDAVIKLVSSTASGNYRVNNGRHFCTDNDFYTEMEVYPA